MASNPLSAKGDLLKVSNGARTNLPLGTNNQILSYDTSNGLHWKTYDASPPAFEPITYLFGATSSYEISFTSIPTTYKVLKIVGRFVSLNDYSTLVIRLRSDSSTYYQQSGYGTYSSSYEANFNATDLNSWRAQFGYNTPQAGTNTGYTAAMTGFEMDIVGLSHSGTSGPSMWMRNWWHGGEHTESCGSYYKAAGSTSPITEINFQLIGPSGWNNGSAFMLYGMK